MSEKLRKVLTGFLALDKEDKEKLSQLIKDYKTIPFTTERKAKELILDSITESAATENYVALGPSPSKCPCCGQ